MAKKFSELVPGDIIYQENGKELSPLTVISLKIGVHGFTIRYKTPYNYESSTVILSKFLEKTVSMSYSTYNDKSAVKIMNTNYKSYCLSLANKKYRRK